MDAKHVKRIVSAQHFLQAVDTPQAGKTSQKANHQTAADADVTGRWRDGHQASNCTRGGAQHRCLAAHQSLTSAPCQHRSGGSAQRIDEGQGSKTVCLEGRASIEAKPARPQQGSAHHGQCQAVRGHGFFAVANALADNVSADQACNGCVDVHHSATCKIKRTHLPDVACLGGHGVNHLFSRVRIGAHPVPHHVGNRCVAEGEPQRHEEQHR